MEATRLGIGRRSEQARKGAGLKSGILVPGLKGCISLPWFRAPTGKRKRRSWQRMCLRGGRGP